MPRYFFDVLDGVDARDGAGRELANDEAARKDAVSLAANYAQDPDNLSEGGLIVVSVRDEAGAIVTTVRLVCQVEVAA